MWGPAVDALTLRSFWGRDSGRAGKSADKESMTRMVRLWAATVAHLDRPTDCRIERGPCRIHHSCTGNFNITKCIPYSRLQGRWKPSRTPRGSPSLRIGNGLLPHRSDTSSNHHPCNRLLLRSTDTTSSDSDNTWTGSPLRTV